MCSSSPAKLPHQALKRVSWARVCLYNCPSKNCSVRGELEAWLSNQPGRSWNLDNEWRNSDCLGPRPSRAYLDLWNLIPSPRAPKSVHDRQVCRVRVSCRIVSPVTRRFLSVRASSCVYRAGRQADRQRTNCARTSHANSTRTHIERHTDACLAHTTINDR